MPATHRKGDTGSRLSTLQQRARAKPVDNFASINTYYRSADLLLRQADVYRRAHNEDELYVMLLRFAGLVVETLPQHRAFVRSDAKYQKLKKALVDTYLPEAERLRASVQLRDQVDLLSRQGPFQPTKSAGTVLLSFGNLPEINWGWGDAAQRPVDAGAALGVPQPAGFDLVSSRAGTVSLDDGTHSGRSPARVQPGAGSAASVPTLLALPELNTSMRLPTASHATLARHALLPPTVSPPQQQKQQPSPAQPSLYPMVPSPVVPPPQPEQQELDAALASLDMSMSHQSSLQQQDGQRPGHVGHPQPSPYGELQLGPQEVEVSLAPRPSEPLPPGGACCQPAPLGQQQAVEAGPAISSGVAEVKRLQQLRDVHVSAALMDEFMRYAASNTRRNIESCGILAGTLSADDAIFVIDTLIVPKQTGTSDTVEMLNEEEIFEVQDSRALYPLGWIHTHPSQTCFLSSVDVHTHCGFQTMLDEAVAIVMAPRDPSKRVGIFRLTTPGGLKLVQRCPQRGFHAHPPTDTGQPIYDLCRHVYLNPRLKHEVVDLR